MHFFGVLLSQMRHSWRILVESLGHRRTTMMQQTGVRQRCATFLPFKGTVNLSDKADVTLSVLLDFSARPVAVASGPGSDAPKHPTDSSTSSVEHALFGLPADRLRTVFVGTCHPTRRPIHVELALPKRAYLGPTSLEPMLALAMCNMAAVGPGTLVLDPFVGTGSIIVAGEWT